MIPLWTPFCRNKYAVCSFFVIVISDITIALFQVNVAHEEQEIHMDVVLSGTTSDDTIHHPAEYMDISDIHSFELERDDIKFVMLLGSGNFGEVFKATLGNDTVAVKSLKGEIIYAFKYVAFEWTALFFSRQAWEKCFSV